MHDVSSDFKDVYPSKFRFYTKRINKFEWFPEFGALVKRGKLSNFLLTFFRELLGKLSDLMKLAVEPGFPLTTMMKSFQICLQFCSIHMISS